MSDSSSYFYQSNILKRFRYANNAAAPSNNELASLIHCDCTNWQLGSTELSLIAEAIISNNPSQESIYPLVSLDISNNRICNLDYFNTDQPDHTGLSNLVQAFLTIAKYSRLKKVNFSNNIILDDGFRLIAELISSNGPIYLQELILRNCDGHSKGLKALSRHMDTNKSLVVLDLSENDFNSKSMEVFAESMKSNRRLKTLHLSSCNIESDSMGSMMNMLQSNYTLSVLNLCHNNLGDAGAEVIGNNLKSVSTLTHIDLQDNNITTLGANALFNGLVKNTCILFLGLKWNRLTDDVKHSFCSCLDTNITLKTVYLVGNAINTCVIEEVVKYSASIVAKTKSKSATERRDKVIDFDIIY
jgi:Ran GTPase-activating protein (RanGAP) involved in mRNA processing and transport